MYAEILQPSAKEQKINIACLIAAIMLLIAIPYIHRLCLMLPPVIREVLMLSAYLLMILLFYRVYTRLVCGFRYAIVLEEQLKLLPKGRGVITMTAGYIVIDRMYGSKGTTEAIIAPEEIKNIISFDRKLFYAEMHKTPLLNRKLFTNRGKENLHALVYERKGQRYLCLIAPSATFLEKLAETLSQTQD